MSTAIHGAPAVSVVIPAFNAACDIAAALESVFAQTFTDYEVIVVNDGSTDNLPAAIHPFQHRLIYIDQPNRGAAAARNTGIRTARGRYVAFLDADDVWHPCFSSGRCGTWNPPGLRPRLQRRADQRRKRAGRDSAS